MFATHAKNRTKTSAQAESKPADAARDGKAAPEPNPVWQSIALCPAGIQAKLAVSQPDGPDEREADHIAERVMRMATPPSSHDELSFTSIASGKAQRKCDGCEEEEEQKLQRKEQGGNAELPETAPPLVHEALNSPGQPLDADTRAFFESRFTYDFGHVRVHTDARASDSAQAVNALAYTVGRDVVFGASQYAPTTKPGRSLLAHELAHVAQQRGAGPVLQRQACPSRPPTEAAQSRAGDGILPDNVVAATNRIDIQDFAVASDVLPPGVTDHIEWQRTMSILTGDPSMLAQLHGYTDCTGSEAENLSLRRARVATVMAAMPSAARARVMLSFVMVSSFLDTNTTPEGRARNRAVRLHWMSLPQLGRQACDLISGAAANLDQYIFLVSCMESRLGLATPANARTALSVLRQIYYGSEDWSLNPNPVWDKVITSTPWSPDANPGPRLGATLMKALRDSYKVEGIDVGHLFAGLDAMLDPQDVTVVLTTIPNEAWATWAGDVGSAAAEWVFKSAYTSPGTQPSQAEYFTRFASDEDLRGDIEGFAIRAGFNPGGTPSSRLMQTLRLSGTLSESLRQYYRLTSSALGRNRSRATREFIEAYGGVLSGATITNRAAFAARLRPSVALFAILYLNMLSRKLSNSNYPTAQPGADNRTLLDRTSDAMTDRFITWLEKHP